MQETADSPAHGKRSGTGIRRRLSVLARISVVCVACGRSEERIPVKIPVKPEKVPESSPGTKRQVKSDCSTGTTNS